MIIEDWLGLNNYSQTIDRVIAASALAGTGFCLILLFAGAVISLRYHHFLESAYTLAGPFTALVSATWATRKIMRDRSGTAKKLSVLQIVGIFLFLLLGCLMMALSFAVGIAFSGTGNEH